MADKATKKLAEKNEEKIDKSLPSQMADTEHGEDSGLALMQEYGASGTAIFDGMIEEDYNAALNGEVAMDTYDQMRRSDSSIASALLMVELPIRAADWVIKAGKDKDGKSDETDMEVRDFIEWNLFERINFDDFIREALGMLPFGFSICEKVYAMVNNQIVIDRLPFRKQKTIEKWQMENGKKGITQVLPTPKKTGKFKGHNRISLPEKKILIFSHRKEGDNYAGTSLLRTAYRHWYLMDRLYRLDALKHEKEALGIPVLKMPDKASSKDKVAAKSILKKIRAHRLTGVLLPSTDWVFEFADPKAGDGEGLWRSIKHHDRAISKNVLAQFMELGETKSGSRALSTDLSELFLMANKAIAKHLQETINTYLVKQLVDFNYNVDRYPCLHCQKLDEDELTAWAESLTKMVGNDVVRVDDQVEGEARRRLNLPDALHSREDDETDSSKGTDPKEDLDKKDKDSGNKPKSKETNSSKDKQTKKEEDDQKEQVNQAKKTHEPPDNFFMSLAGIVNNKRISDLQAQVSEQDSEALKKKGFKLNVFEKESPRVMTFAERKVNFSTLKRAMDKQGGILSGKYEKITKRQKNQILSDIEEAVKNNDLKKLSQIKATFKGDFTDAVDDVRREMFDIGKKTAANEMSVPVPPTKKSVSGAMRLESKALVDDFASGLEGSAVTAVTQQISKAGGDIADVTVAEAKAAASASMTKVIDKGIAAIQTLSVTGTLNLGRGSIFKRYAEKIYGFQYSAILDGVTTDTCRSLDGVIMKPNAVKWTPPLHFNCRSILVEILKEEIFKPDFTSNISTKIPTNKTIDTFKDMPAPVLQKNAPALNVVKNEIAKRQSKIDGYLKTGKFQNRIQQHQKRINALKRGLEGKDPVIQNSYNFLKTYLMSTGIRFKK